MATIMQQNLLDYEPGSKPVFVGSTFVFLDHDELTGVTRNNGGIVVQAADRTVDFVVTSELTEASEKAVRFGARCVKPSYIQACIDAGQLVSRDSHGFPELESYIVMDNLLLQTTNEPSAENFLAIQTHYNDNMMPNGKELSKRSANRFLQLIYGYAGNKTESKVNPQLTETSKQAFSLFYFLVRNDVGFQDAVERATISSLAKRLKLERHLNDEDGEHRREATSLTIFLSTNYPRFKDLKNYLGTESRQTLDTASLDLPRESFEVTVPRLSEDNRPVVEGAYYDMSFEETAALFKVDLDTGLSDAEVAQRAEQHGPNELPKTPPTPWFIVLGKQFLDFFVIIILVAGVVSLGLQEWIEGGVLMFLIFINVLIGFVQEMKAQKAVEALAGLVVAEATVIRGGTQVQVPSRDLVPGDIVVLSEGTAVPADLRMFQAQSIRIIEAALTGEGDPVKKSVAPIRGHNVGVGDRVNMAFMSTTVTGGDGRGLVVATGTKTEVGKITKNMESAKPGPTKLQLKLKKLGVVLLILATVLCALVIGVTFAWLAGRHPEGIPEHESIEAVKIGISLAISAIPEGLIAVVTISLAAGVSRMATQNAIVRTLPSVETLGSITTICSDKTGTLTVGQMKTEVLWTAAGRSDGNSYHISGVGIEPEGDVINDDTGDRVGKNNMSEVFSNGMLVCSLCNGSSILQDETSERWTYTGDPTEVALLVAAYKVDMGQPALIKNGWEMFGRAPFDSDRKRMTVLATSPEGQSFAFAKGAPENLLRKCTHTVDENGERVPLDDDLLAKAERVSGDYASEGLRVLALAYRHINRDDYDDVEDNALDFEEDLTFLGLAGMIDPPRAPVRAAVETCKNAGIRVVMITGDHPRTAYAIAQKLGIAPKQDNLTRSFPGAMKGSDLAALNAGQLASMDPFPTVFARVSPEDKMDIIHALQANNEVVSMTGDGVNDAPAIKHADVGVAMGITGTDLTKQSADIILRDDNFTSIVAAVSEGRRIFDNVQKFVIYLLSCNSSQIWTFLVCAIAGLPTPLSAIMVLYANLVVGGPPAIAIGVDSPASDILDRKPRDPASGVISRRAVYLIAFQGGVIAALAIMQFVLALFVFDLGYDAVTYEANLAYARTVCFQQIAMCHLWQAFMSRSTTQSVFAQSPFGNVPLVLCVLLAFLLLIGAIYVPGWQTVFEQVPLDIYAWIQIATGLMLHTGFVELFKYLLRHGMCAPKRRPGEKVMFYDSV